MQVIRVPPLTSNIQQACHHCSKDENIDHKLAKCSQCKAVSYCGSECQKAAWKNHKSICKAIVAVEKDPSAKAILTFSLSPSPNSDISFTNQIGQDTGSNEHNLIRTFMKRDLTMPEQNLIAWQPRCMACARTERMLRMENSPNTSTSQPTLKPCQDCRTSFYCSDSHWEAVRSIHQSQPSPDGHDNLTHCQINKEIRADILFSNVMADAYVNSGLGGTEDFKWAPERTKASWEPLKTGNGQGNWEAEFEEDLKKGFGDAAATPMAFMPFLRGSSEGLSFPMTILYGLQTLKSGDEWTKQKKLTVHVLGAFEKEIVLAQIFEEILHRLPQVQEIRIVLIGPELGKVIQDSSPMEMDTCPDCSRNERKRIHEHHALTYHDYVKKQGTRYTKPDIAVAFNSGCHESPSSWTETFKVLVQKGVTCLFTSYNQEEANQDSKLLQSSGIRTQLLEVKKNPWGSMKLANEPNRVYGFYSTNGWLAGGFSG